MSIDNPAVGIDLGTTNTVVSVQTDSTGPIIFEIPQPVVERKELDEQSQIKSVVYFEKEGSAVVGAFANTRMNAFRSIKSQMGTRWHAKNPVNNKLVNPAYISAHILKLAFQTIKKKFPDWDNSALITVPASFNTDQRNDTILATDMAGFKDINLLDEPTAAFYYFFSMNRESGEFDKDQYILVFDFGGGTLDVSIIYITHQGDKIILDAIGRSRYNNLGGDDIDLEIASFMLGCWEFENELKVNALDKDLRAEIYQLFINSSREFKEQAEDALMNEEEIPEFFIAEEVLANDLSKNIEFRRSLTQAQYEEVTSTFLQPKSDLNIYRPIEEAISVAKDIVPEFSKKELGIVLYTGGASSMSSVRRALFSHFPDIPCFSIDENEPCNTVALGAAACRYDQKYGEQNIVMSNRLLESLFTRLPKSKEYLTIVPLTCEPSDEWRKVEGRHQLQRPTIVFKLPLFRGVSVNDHQLAPIRDLEISLQKVMDAKSEFEISYRMTRNKTISLKIAFHSDGKTINETTDLNLQDESLGFRTLPPLFNVNPV